MTHKELTKKINELVNHKETVTWLRKECLRLAKSGAIYVEKAECNYVLPKNLLLVALENLSRQYRPFNKHDEKNIKNLRHF